MISIKKQGEQYEVVDENGNVLFEFPQDRYQELVQAFSMENLKGCIRDSITDLSATGHIPQHISEDKLVDRTFDTCKKYGDSTDFFVFNHNMIDFMNEAVLKASSKLSLEEEIENAASEPEPQEPEQDKTTDKKVELRFNWEDFGEKEFSIMQDNIRLLQQDMDAETVRMTCVYVGDIAFDICMGIDEAQKIGMELEAYFPCDEDDAEFFTPNSGMGYNSMLSIGMDSMETVLFPSPERFLDCSLEDFRQEAEQLASHFVDSLSELGHEDIAKYADGKLMFWKINKRMGEFPGCTVQKSILESYDDVLVIPPGFHECTDPESGDKIPILEDNDRITYIYCGRKDGEGREEGNRYEMWLGDMALSDGMMRKLASADTIETFLPKATDMEKHAKEANKRDLDCICGTISASDRDEKERNFLLKFAPAIARGEDQMDAACYAMESVMREGCSLKDAMKYVERYSPQAALDGEGIFSRNAAHVLQKNHPELFCQNAR